jgi:Kef-type K+ transport system membrane component KefB
MKKFFQQFVQSTAIALTVGFVSMGTPTLAAAAGASAGHGHDTQAMAMILIVLAAILISGKVFHLVERIQQPPVVGELLAGIVLGNIALLGFPLFREFNHDTIIQFLAQLGVILLLFQIGLEANIKELLKVGSKSALVAIIGAVLPFVLTTFFIAPMLMPGQPFITYLFTGATMVATSVGIGIRVFKDMGKLKSKAATIFLGATIIDDILSLIILAVLTPMAAGSEITGGEFGFIFFKAIGFLVASIVVGQLAAPYIGKMFAKVHTGQGSKFTLSISLALIFGALASFLSLEPIIGAFAAGLVLDPVHFKDFKDPELVEEIKGEIADLTVKQRKVADRLLNIRNILRRHSHNSVEDLIAPLGLFLVPIFFVTTGVSVQLESLARLDTIGLALLLTVVAYITKFAAGLVVGGKNGILVGLAMVPRGEVGLIFATLGKSLGVFNDQIFSVIVVTVLLTTIGAPALLMNALKENSSNMMPKLPKLKLAKLWAR